MHMLQLFLIDMIFFIFSDIILHALFQEFNLVKSYVSKIQELENELLHLKSLNSSKHTNFVVDGTDFDDDGLHAKNAYFRSLHELSSTCDTKGADSSSNIHEMLVYLFLWFAGYFFSRTHIVIGGAYFEGV